MNDKFDPGKVNFHENIDRTNQMTGQGNSSLHLEAYLNAVEKPQ
jgi:hypothetical protein